MGKIRSWCVQKYPKFRSKTLQKKKKNNIDKLKKDIVINSDPYPLRNYPPLRSMYRLNIINELSSDSETSSISSSRSSSMSSVQSNSQINNLSTKKCNHIPEENNMFTLIC